MLRRRYKPSFPKCQALHTYVLDQLKGGNIGEERARMHFDVADVA
jgi:hypothetical protein